MMGTLVSYFEHLERREAIKAGLRSRGTSLSQVSRDLGLKPATISSVVAGARSKRVEAAIADALGEKLEALWPERYPE